MYKIKTDQLCPQSSLFSGSDVLWEVKDQMDSRYQTNIKDELSI